MHYWLVWSGPGYYSTLGCNPPLEIHAMFIFNYHSSCLHTYKCVDVDASFTVLHIVGLGCVSSSVSALATNAYIMKQ